MNQECIKKIEKALPKIMEHDRYIHTLGVVEAAVYLADKYGIDREKARIAALMHDYAKGFSKKEIFQYIHRFQLEIDPILEKTYELLHGKIAAHIALQEYGIEDQDILNAIEYHTTSRVEASPLEIVIYLADFIEVGRDYPGVEDLRMTAEESLDKAFLQALNNTIIFVLSIEKPLHPNTVHARNEQLIRLNQ